MCRNCYWMVSITHEIPQHLIMMRREQTLTSLDIVTSFRLAPNEPHISTFNISLWNLTTLWRVKWPSVGHPTLVFSGRSFIHSPRGLESPLHLLSAPLFLRSSCINLSMSSSPIPHHPSLSRNWLSKVRRWRLTSLVRTHPYFSRFSSLASINFSSL